MCDPMTDTLIRIASAEPDELRAIYQTDLQRPGWNEEERETLMEAFYARASYLNAASLNLHRPRLAMAFYAGYPKPKPL